MCFELCCLVAGKMEADPITVGADDVSALSSDVIILDVGFVCLQGMTCGGCSANVKRILELMGSMLSASFLQQVDANVESQLKQSTSEVLRLITRLFLW
ncbi:hypothetical protein L1987_06697 [Smallanthus sonchifolius]|uniref:Uncharacterized protein n=1 Tax=Smallanthus sonchifolius TaxID=185202 RepID=A0ACB9JYY3_9ASTR|nr:hypothetical protein L1987_06697 [Smallanthus sonchifolius]